MGTLLVMVISVLLAKVKNHACQNGLHKDPGFMYVLQRNMSQWDLSWAFHSKLSHFSEPSELCCGTGVLFCVKVHIFWEDNKILRNLHRRFVLCSNCQLDSVKSTVEILQNFVAFSEYMNFNGQYPPGHHCWATR